MSGKFENQAEYEYMLSRNTTGWTLNFIWLAYQTALYYRGYFIHTPGISTASICIFHTTAFFNSSLESSDTLRIS